MIVTSWDQRQILAHTLYYLNFKVQIPCEHMSSQEDVLSGHVIGLSCWQKSFSRALETHFAGIKKLFSATVDYTCSASVVGVIIFLTWPIES